MIASVSRRKPLLLERHAGCISGHRTAAAREGEAQDIYIFSVRRLDFILASITLNHFSSNSFSLKGQLPWHITEREEAVWEERDNDAELHQAGTATGTSSL